MGTASSSIHRATAAALVALALALACSACGGRAAPTAAGPYDVDRALVALDPALRRRLLASPHTYFRLVTSQFATEVCRSLKDDLPFMGIVNLHGDAHLEQYAVTDAGRGLADYDAAALGPPAIDLVRFAASIAIVNQMLGRPGETDATIDAFFDAYREALRETERAPEPRVVARIRARFGTETSTWFGWLASISKPLAPDGLEAVRRGFDAYVTSTLEQAPTLDRDYFQVVTMASARLGVASAGVQKFVVRVRGATEAPDDDQVLEMKEMIDLAAVPCLSGPTGTDPLRVLVGQARLSYEPYRLAGRATIDGRAYAVHAWARNYREIVPTDVESADELQEIAVDVGVQLGRGHPRHVAPPLDHELRSTLGRYVAERADALRDLAKSMANEVSIAWLRLREEEAPK